MKLIEIQQITHLPEEVLTLKKEAVAEGFQVSEEQAQVAREADQNLTTIRELSIQSSAGASQTASACSEMANLAIELNHLVARFKV